MPRARSALYAEATVTGETSSRAASARTLGSCSPGCNLAARMPSSMDRDISFAVLPLMWYLCAVMIYRLYHNEPIAVNRPRPWPWTDHPPRSFGRKRHNDRGGDSQPPRRIVLDAPPSDRVRVQRLAARARYDRATLEAILDESFV